jgi:hypothetical protein
MRKSLKIVAVAAVLLLALGAIILVYANTQESVKTSNDEQQASAQNMWTFFRSGNITMPGRMMRKQQIWANGPQCVRGFMRNVTLSTVQGTEVTEFKGTLLLNTSSGQVRILLPKYWSVGSQILNSTTLFNGTFASPGSYVTVKVLESIAFSNSNFSINVMVGYEAINATGAQAYAVLPFNIQPNS